VGDDHAGCAGAGAESGFETDLAGLNVNLLFHYSPLICWYFNIF
jgi:hypothetical protein